ncbi:hypothetical protein HDV00_002545 [Rhizophlyctis rosea]|nr:hypothetical protein HDV00_002545 [Rhizophlyctis rosea]
MADCTALGAWVPGFIPAGPECCEFGRSYHIFQCDETGHMTSLNITGRAPLGVAAAALQNVKDLQELYAGDNGWVSLPEELAHLSQLRILQLDNNQLSDIAVLGRLKSLNNNKIQKLTSDLADLPELSTFKARGNQLSGPFPSVILTWPKLTYLDLGQNQIQGSLPNDWGKAQGPGVTAAAENSNNTTTSNDSTQQSSQTTAQQYAPYIAGSVVGIIFGIIGIAFSIKYWTRGSGTRNKEYISSNASDAGLLGDGKPSLDGSVGGGSSVASTTMGRAPEMEETSLKRGASLRVFDLEGGGVVNPMGVGAAAVGGAVVGAAMPLPSDAHGSGYDPMRRRYRVVRAHVPRNADELGLFVGEVVTVERAFQDQWCLGWTHRTGHRGMFPLSCTTVIDATDVEESRGNIEPPSVLGPKNSIHGSTPVPYNVIKNHRPDLLDEMPLREGQSVVVEHFYRDGWCLGYNETTRDRGLFPIGCIGKRGDLLVDTRSRGSMESVTDSLMMESPTSAGQEGQIFDTIRLSDEGKR